MNVPTSVFAAFLLSCAIASSAAFSAHPTFGSNSAIRVPTNLFSTANSAGSDHRMVEFTNLEPLPENAQRRERMERDNENKAKFVGFGDDLWALRSKMDKLSTRLIAAIEDGEEDLEEKTRQKLRSVEQKDPELVYMLELADLKDAVSADREEDAKVHAERAQAARSCLPQFNLEGLWVGKYGSNGYELINVTYVGDVLVAEKITSDKNVPRGEITFQVDLNPLKASNPSPFQEYDSGTTMQDDNQALQPIKLTEKAARKWGTSQLPRYAGLGQVAEEGFRNNQWMDGQLIVIGEEYFSFAWLPIEHQIFFGRPSPELALKMLRDCGVSRFRSPMPFEKPPSMDADFEVQKHFVARCLEITHEVHDEILAGQDEDASLGCIWHGSSEECYFE